MHCAYVDKPFGYSELNLFCPYDCPSLNNKCWEFLQRSSLSDFFRQVQVDWVLNI